MSRRLVIPLPRRLPRAGLAGALLTLALMAGLWALGPRLGAVSALMPGNEPAGPLSPERADAAARRAGAAFADAQSFWARRLPAETGRDYAPAALVFFMRLAPSPCAGPLDAAGPFYCAASRTVALDLVFLEQLGRRLRGDADRGAALFVARVAVVHAQAEAGSEAHGAVGARGAGGAAHRANELRAALEADCLTGVWAAEAEPRVGPLPATLYGRVIEAARIVSSEQTPSGAARPDGALLAPGRRSEREAAFARGLEAGNLAACLGS